ncbi:MAG TPA: metal-sulfur cluster assembly factor [Streptosporangiaceae bacterium]|jgi:metal-sulfur cluster biosynthetic enzyme|nr:metal-sulfur cluster assembly factor [Streptosporangiaceae bacterium]
MTEQTVQSQDGTQPDDPTAAGPARAGASQTPVPESVAADSPTAGSGLQDDDLLEALRDVVDPELGINVVDLGLVYGVSMDADRVATIDMTLTSAACPLTDVIEDQTRDALEGLVADFRINWVWLPPWGPDKITEDGREQLRALGFNV